MIRVPAIKGRSREVRVFKISTNELNTSKYSPFFLKFNNLILYCVHSWEGCTLVWVSG